MQIRPALWVWFAARAARFRMTQARPTDSVQVTRPGPDPIRVLVTGAGLAVGYGVGRQDDSLAGALADRLAATTGRGVVVDVRSVLVLPARKAIAHIGPEGTAGYDVAVFAPCYLEASVTPGTGLHRFGAAIQDHLIATGSPDLRVLVLGLPRPDRFSWVDLAAAAAATEANTVLRRNAAAHPQVRYVEAPRFSSVQAERPLDEEYYRGVGEALAAPLSTLPARAVSA